MQQFRAKRFFLFLEWCTFVAMKHNLPGSEGLIDLLAEELISCGIDEHDIYNLALLDHLMQAEEILPEQFYAYISIKAAFFIVMERIHLGDTKSISLTEENHSHSQQEEFFNQTLVRIPTQEIINLKQKFAPIINKLCIIKQYLLILRDHPEVNRNQQLYLSRVCLIENLYSYLKIQSELSGAVLSELADYIKKIRNQAPLPWEFEYIEKIYSKSVIEQLTDSITNKLFKFTVFFTAANPHHNSTINKKTPNPKN